VIKLVNSSIYKKIEDKGNLEAEEIYKAGQEKAAALEKTILDGYDKEYKKIVESANRQNEDYLKTKLTQVDQTAKQKSLFLKKEKINEVMKKVHQQLNKISDKELFDLVVKTISSEKIQGNEVLKVSKSDYSKYVRIFASNSESKPVVLDLLNNKLGSKYHLTISNEPADIDGGFILMGNTYDIDHSFIVLLDELRETYETEIAKTLFGSGE